MVRALGGAKEVRSFISPPSGVERKVGGDCYGPQAYGGSLLGTNWAAGFMKRSCRVVKTKVRK